AGRPGQELRGSGRRSVSDHPAEAGRDQWEIVFSTPTPVRERTSISTRFSGNSSFFPRKVPTMPNRKASGIEMMPGLDSGKNEKSTLEIMDVSLPETAGENAISTSVLIRPPYMENSAPVVLNRFQNSEYRMVGRLADAAMAKARATRNAMFWPMAPIPMTIDRMPITTTVIRETRSCDCSEACP